MEQYEGQDRREESCPCKHIVELKGNIDLVKLEADYAKAALKQEVVCLLTDYKEINLQIKECLMSMQQSSTLLNDGNRRMKDIEKELEAQKTAAKNNESPIRVINTFIQYQSYFWTWVAAVTIMLFVGGHAEQAIAWIKAWV